MSALDTDRAADGPVAPEPVLELDGVTKEYPTDPVTRVLHGIDLRFARGELVAIVGPSGSGKSTLLHIIGTLDRPTSGRVVIAGQDVVAPRRRRAVRAARHARSASSSSSSSSWRA